MKDNLLKQTELNQALQTQQQSLRPQYDDLAKEKDEIVEQQRELVSQINFIHDAIHKIMPNKQLPSIEMIGRPMLSPPHVKLTSPSSRQSKVSATTPPSHMPASRMSVPTAAAKKMGVGFPLNNLLKDETGRILSTQRPANDELMNECGICKKCTDQHVLVKCDNCKLYYHLGCLNPPLTRMPKKSKIYSWQCSECDKSDGSEPESKIIPKGPRKSRVRYSKDGPIYSDPLRNSFGSEKSSIVSRKSDDSFKNFNGSETDLSIKIPTEPVPTTSTPVEPTATKAAKKRVRKAKPKKSETQQESTTPDLASTLNPTVTNHLTTQAAPDTSVDQSTVVVKAKKPRKKKIKTENAESLVESAKSPNSEIPTPSTSGMTTPQLVSVDTVVKKRKGRPPKKPKLPVDETAQPAQPTADLLHVMNNIEIRPVIDNNASETFTKTSSDVTGALTLLTSEPMLNGAGDYLNGDSSSSAHHKHKKRKSHKRRHSRTPSEGGDVPPKKHKRKRKHKLDGAVDTESSSAQQTQSDATNSERSPEQPRIKMKIKKVVGNDVNFMCSLPSPTGSDQADVKAAKAAQMAKVSSFSSILLIV